MTFKSPQLLIIGKIATIRDTNNDKASFYIKVRFLQGDQWKLTQGITKFETFQSQSSQSIAAIDHPFSLHYICQDIRGWPRVLLEVWKVDGSGRHNLHGYGTAAMPMSSGHYKLQIPCWRPVGTWYDRFIGASSELQYPGIVASSLNRYGLRTFSGCIVNMQVDILGRNFQLHGVVREAHQHTQEQKNVQN